MKMGVSLKHLAREPLVHFLLAGLLVFIIASWRGVAVDPADRTIRIDEAKVGQLAQQFEQTWQRGPSPAEIDQLIRDYVREEVYYREGLRLGLDQDDPVIRRRLRAKMEFLAAEAAENAVPSDPQLQAWLDSNKARYATGALYSFEQVYIGQGTPAQLAGKAKAALARLTGGADPATVGAAISLPGTMERQASDVIEDAFGGAFSQALTGLPLGRWSGPISSGYGVHLVRLKSRIPGQMPHLPDVRQRVENDWREATLTRRQEAAYQALLDGYTVRITKP